MASDWAALFFFFAECGCGRREVRLAAELLGFERLGYRRGCFVGFLPLLHSLPLSAAMFFVVPSC